MSALRGLWKWHLWLWPWQKVRRCLFCGRFNMILVGENSITLSPAGVGDVARWSATKNAVAEGDLGMDVATGLPNAFIAGVLRNLPGLVQSGFAEVTVDTTTTSATFVDLLTVAITTGARTVFILVTFGADGSSNNNGPFFRVTIDGVAKRGAPSNKMSGTNGTGSGAILYQEVLSAAAHTVKVQWRVGAGTGSIRPVTQPDSEHCSLRVFEVAN